MFSEGYYDNLKVREPFFHGGDFDLRINHGDFYAISSAIDRAKSVEEKLILCERGLTILPEFVADMIWEDGKLPPVIMCRDVTPELYMRQGDWENAERVIRFCMNCNAYYPDTGEKVLAQFEEYRDTACMAMVYIMNHPGTLQKDVYKRMKQVAGSDTLKSILRASELFRKEKQDRTNRLYLSEQALSALGPVQTEIVPVTRTVPEDSGTHSPTVLSYIPEDSPRSDGSALVIPKKKLRLGVAAAALVAILALGGGISYANNQVDVAATAAYSEGVAAGEASIAGEVKRAEEERDKALSEVSQAEKENSSLSATVSRLTHENDTKDEKIEELEAQVSSLNKELDAAKGTTQSAASTSSSGSSSNSSSGTTTPVTLNEDVGYDSTETRGAHTVYVTRTGSKYHESGCRYLSDSKIAMSLSDAQARGYSPCSVCH